MNGKIIAGAAALLVLLGVALYLLSDDSQPRARAGDAGVAGAQEDDPARRPPNTVRDARGMQGNGADDPVARLLDSHSKRRRSDAGAHLRVHIPGSDHKHVHLRIGEPLLQAFGEGIEGGLRGSVDIVVPTATLAGN